MMRPDGFAGTVLGAESFEDVRCLISGPAGCRNRYAQISSRMRRTVEDRERFKIPYFKGSPRVPCTFADEEDFINGGEPKVADALSVIRGVCDDYVAIVDTPGTSLIGDDHRRAVVDSGMSGRAVPLSSNLYSRSFTEGYDVTVRRITEFLAPERRDPEPMTVNIIGLPMAEKDWWHALRHLEDLLGLMGVRIVAPLGAGASSQQVRDAGRASANLVVRPEYGLRTARHLEKELGTPCVVCPDGAPVGLDATGSWIRTAAAALGADPAPAIAAVDGARREIARAIARNRSFERVMQGSTFSVSCLPSTAYPLSRWLSEFLGMVPASIVADDPCGCYAGELRGWLDSTGQDGVLGSGRPPVCGVVVSDGYDALQAQESRRCAVGIGAEFPFPEDVSLLPGHILGAEGSLWIAERIMNSLDKTLRRAGRRRRGWSGSTGRRRIPHPGDGDAASTERP